MTTFLRILPSRLSRLTRTQAGAALASVSAAAVLVATTQTEKDERPNSRKQHDAFLRNTLLPKPLLASCERHESARLLQRNRTVSLIEEFSTKDHTLESRYKINWRDTPLGEGAFGTVHLGKNRETGEQVALKKIPKKFTDESAFQHEIAALLRIRSNGGHPNICALQENFDYGESYILILDYISGGEMFDHLVDNGAYSEADASHLIREVSSALAYLHGIGIVHADLKPENLMLSTPRRTDSVVKLVDFGCAVFLDSKDDQRDEDNIITPAYCPPECLSKNENKLPPMDCWSLGVILYVMLTGVHPFDLEGNSTDKQMVERIKNPKKYKPPLYNSRFTAHLSPSAIDLISQLMHPDPKKRMTADKMLQHPWVRGETATTKIIAGSDKRLNKIRVYKTKLQTQFFQDAVAWSDNEDEIRRKTSLIELSFQALDGKDGNIVDEGQPLSMTDYKGLLSENMKNSFFPKGTIIYKEGDVGNHMYFLNSGTIEVTTKDGSRAVRNQGDFFGEGALLHPKKIRSATIKCLTPVHAMQISREYFEKYLKSSESGLILTLREKDKIRKRNRAKTILRLQKDLKELKFNKGDYLFKHGEDGDAMYILEEGRIDVLSRKNRHILSVTPGNLCGEHSLLTGRKRNTSAVCVADGGCKAQAMMGRDFRKLITVSPSINDSLHELLLRREFKKAVVTRLNTEFPYKNPKKAFDAVDKAKKGVLDKEAIGNLMKEMDPEYTDEQIEEVIQALSLTHSDSVSFDEFKKVFIGDIRTAASI